MMGELRDDEHQTIRWEEQGLWFGRRKKEVGEGKGRYVEHKEWGVYRVGVQQRRGGTPWLSEVQYT